MPRSRADWDRARARVPYVEDVDWRKLLASQPDMLYRIIADAYGHVLRERAPKIGQRSFPDPVALDKVTEAVFPMRYSMDPFPVALADLIGEESQRSFSAKVPCNQGALSKMLAGRVQPGMVMMERLAAAVGVGPWYFIEWRAEYVAALVRRIFVERPEMGARAIDALRSMAGGRNGHSR